MHIQKIGQRVVGFVEQVLGNVGRFNKAGDTTSTPGRKTPEER